MTPSSYYSLKVFLLIKISGNVCEPFASEIVNKYHRHFFELIQSHYKVYPDRRQF